MEEKLFYDSDNNIKLCGILNKSNNDKVVIMCHGIRGNKEECGSFTYLAEILQEEGYSSFRFDFNGHCKKMRLITTNDNLRALQFYQKRGYFLTKLYPNAMEEVRKIKPDVPALGDNDIPLKDEIELEKQL